MQRVIFMLVLLAVSASAQQVGLAGTRVPAAQISERTLPVTYSDLYCSGFMAPQPLPHDKFIAAGLGTAVQSLYKDGDLIYLRGGGYAPGARFSIIRELQDPNHYTPFPVGKRLLSKAGQLYADLGYATIVENRGTDIAVAQVDFSCESIVAGDLIVPFAPKATLNPRTQSTMDRFPAERGKVSGRIMASRNFDQFPSAGSKIYLNVGDKSGVKPGDYFRIIRGYETAFLDPTDQQTYQQPTGEDTQRNAPKMNHKEIRDLPYRVVGEAFILNAQPDTATAMITFAMEEVQIGDIVELEENQSH